MPLQVYESIAKQLTHWENHMFPDDHERALIIKLFIFQFANNYTSFFYIAFLKVAAIFALVTHHDPDVCCTCTCQMETL